MADTGGNGDRMSDGVAAEVAALREQVQRLADRVGVDPTMLPPDRPWTSGDEHYADWDVNHRCSVRAGVDDRGMPVVALVERQSGDMGWITSLEDARRLVASLQAAIVFAADEFTQARFRKRTAEERPVTGGGDGPSEKHPQRR